MSNTVQQCHSDERVESGQVRAFPLIAQPEESTDDAERVLDGRPLDLEAQPFDRGLPYLVCFPTVRDGLLRVLAAPDKGIDTRLVALMDVCDRLTTYFDENCTGVDERRLLEDLDGAFVSSFRASPSWADTMTERVSRFYLSECVAVGPPRFLELLTRIRRRYGPALAPEQRWDPEAVLRAYRRRRARLLLCHGRRLDRQLTDYCLNHLLVEPYVDWPDLRAYATDLALRIASFRLFLFSHPAVGCAWQEGAVAKGEAGTAKDWVERSFEDAAAETFLHVGRALEDPELLARLREKTGVDQVPGAAGLCGLVTL